MIEKLSKGYERFRNGYFLDNRERLERLADKQTPDIAMISCCDSRVDPGILFDLEPGELFVIRNVANLVPPFETKGDYHGTSAALQFAVTCLHVKQVVVLGHANCGGIRALMENNSAIHTEGFIDSWMNLAAKAKEEVLASEKLTTLKQRIDACEKTAVRHSLSNLMTYPWIRERVDTGNLDLVGCYYDLRNGELIDLDEIKLGQVT
ncbi:Carbonic anhydrase, beta class [hydrothermal vent metagenome]|uniref:carbonic anhydrase n=1 Tax=hydrothermal vent metagenome TaxID=652676 RepID=A0A3B0X0L6_9ZZZZ